MSYFIVKSFLIMLIQHDFFPSSGKLHVRNILIIKLISVQLHERGFKSDFSPNDVLFDC